MKHLPLPDLDYIKSILDYDLNTGIFIYKVKTAIRIKVGQIAGCIQLYSKRPDKKYYIISINKNEYKAHRLAYYYVTNIDPGDMQIDHINGNTLDNRFENLRLATGAENIKNQKKRKTNTSGFKGVSWNKHHKKWAAQITVNRKTIYLGYYTNKFYAALVYARAAKKYFGEWRRV